MLEGGGFSHETVGEFLNKAVEPPPEVSVANAVRLLQDIGAFEVSTSHHPKLSQHMSRGQAPAAEAQRACLSDCSASVEAFSCLQLAGLEQSLLSSSLLTCGACMCRQAPSS